jgi:hypothetical protein
LDDKIYRVEEKRWRQKKFKRDHAYLLGSMNDYVYPYRGEIENIEFAHQVGIYLLKEGNRKKVIVRKPKSDYDKMLYSKKRIFELTPDVIFNQLQDDIDDIPEIVTAEGDIFAPPITPEDDIALAGMKYVIGKKQIDFNQYANRFESPSMKNNGRNALMKGHTLKMEMANRFSQVFDINFALLFWDKPGAKNPASKNGEVFVIFNNEEIDLKDPDIDFITIERK